MPDNEQLIRGAYAAMAAGDGRALAALLTPTSRWVIAGRGPLAGSYEGPDAIFGLWKNIAAQTGGGLRLEVVDVLANERRAVALVRATGRRLEATLDENQVAVFELDGGSITEARFIYEDPDAYDTFWATADT